MMTGGADAMHPLLAYTEYPVQQALLLVILADTDYA